MRGEAFDVALVDDELFEPTIRRCRSLPVESIIDDDRLGNDGSVVATILDGLAGTWLRIVGEQQIVGVAKLPSRGFRVRVEEQFGVVESKAPLRAVFTANLVAVQLSGLDVVHVRVPDELVALLETDDVGWSVISFVEQQKEDFGGVPGVE